MLDLNTLVHHLSTNRFLPCPPQELIFCGDGDFRTIGAEFLHHFVQKGKLQPHEHVLDIGSGIGRMAIPLTQYLDEKGSYVGVDIVEEGIRWSNENITSVYPSFKFQHLDIQHDLYNPKGQMAKTTSLPFEDKSFDFIFLVSVLTHLDTEGVLHYAKEIKRLLKDGGRCFATCFLMNKPAKECLSQGKGRIGFDPGEEGPVYYANASAPMAGVAFGEDHFLEKFLRFGLKRRSPAVYGHWSGRNQPTFQDICIFEGG